MTHPSKTKGNDYERELVNQAKLAGLRARRAYASNGESLGESPGVDCLIGDLRVQAKRRKKIPIFLNVPEGADAVAFREDHGRTFVMITWEKLLELLGSCTESESPESSPPHHPPPSA